MTPKSSTDTPVPPRERILAAADELFHKQGIRGVGVEAIAEAADTNKMTLYRHFSSKDELIAEWVRGIVAQKEAVWEDINAKNPGDARAQLADWSRRFAAKLADMEGRGSALANALAELPERDHPARRIIEAHKLREHKRVQKLCEASGFQDPALAANMYYLLLEGATSCVQCKGLKRIGEDLVELVTRMIANSRNQQQRL
jgi:AcrR family transcriptional regulator